MRGRVNAIMRALTVFDSGLTTARFALHGEVLPGIEDAVLVGEAFRRAVLGCAKRLLGPARIPRELSGHERPNQSNHQHAFWLPEPDAAGRVTHVLVHVPGGLSPAGVQVLSALRYVRLARTTSLLVTCEGLGDSTWFATRSAFAGESDRWQSVTPYLHPWHLKRTETRSPSALHAALLRQLRREWHARAEALPEIETFCTLSHVTFGERSLTTLDFRRFRCKRELAQPDTVGRLIEVRFAASIHGPLALGFACHFGLGLFVPVRS